MQQAVTIETKDSTNYFSSQPKLISGEFNGGKTIISHRELSSARDGSAMRNPLDVLQPNSVLFSKENLTKNHELYYGK